MPARPAAEPPLVITLDVGSSSVRALAFDARGRNLGLERQLDYAPDTTPDGGVEYDAEVLGQRAREAVDGLVADLGDHVAAVAAVAISTFWHTLVGIGADGRARTPVYSWADTRSAAHVERLRERLDEKAYHARTGCPLHTSYLPARLLWLREHDPAAFAACRRFGSFGEYLQLRLFGEHRASLSMASGTGLFDLHARRWDPEALEAVGLEPDQLAALVDLDAPFRGLRPDLAARWPALGRVPWLPAVGDGACSNVGAGCFTEARAALMVGTSGAMRVCWPTDRPIVPPPGLWCYRVDGRRLLLGGSLSNGGSLYAWLRETLRVPEDLQAELAGLPPDGHGLTILPFLAGERSTGWVARARAAIVGLSLATQPAEIVRAGMETVAYRFALVHALLAGACPEAREIVATGGALAASPAWSQIMADVLGAPVRPSTEAEGSSRGAALLALEALSLVPSLADAPPGFGPTIEPDAERHARYREGLARHRHLYETLMPFYRGRSPA
jgi:gluconokinase